MSFHQLALNQWRRGRPAEAIETIEKYLEYDITNGALERLMLIQFNADAGEFAAVEDLASELAGDFSTFDGYTILSQSLRRLGREAEAAELLERGVSAHPEYAAGYDQLVNLYFQMDDSDRMLETLERWQRIAPGDTVVQDMIEDLKAAGDASDANVP